MERDYRIDSIRGLVLVSITIEHLGLPFSKHFSHMLGIFSFAEALVFMSGLVTGITCYKTYARRGMPVLTRHALERFSYIYLGQIIPCAIILSLAAVSASALRYFASYMPLLASVPAGDNTLTGIWLYMLPLIYQPTFFDIFPMFMLFMLLSPIFAFLIGKKLSPLIFALSGGVWLAIQLGLGHHWFHDWTLNGVPIGGLFDPFAWQFLFFLGFYFGFRMHLGTPAFTRRPAFLAVCGLICLAGLGLRYNILPYAWNSEDLLYSKTNVGILRLINFAAFACLLAEFGRHFAKILVWRGCVLLGQHSLQVFAFQIILLYLSGPIIWRLAEKSSLLLDSYAIVVVLGLAVPALAHVQYRNWRAGPKKSLALETPK